MQEVTTVPESDPFVSFTLFIVPVIFLFGISLIIALKGLLMQRKVIQQKLRYYRTTNGVIEAYLVEEVSLKGGKESVWESFVILNYKVNGRNYINHKSVGKLYPASGRKKTFSQESVEKNLKSNYSLGEPIPLYYNSLNPEQVDYHKGIHSVYLLIPVLGIILLAVGFGFLNNSLREYNLVNQGILLYSAIIPIGSLLVLNFALFIFGNLLLFINSGKSLT